MRARLQNLNHRLSNLSNRAVLLILFLLFAGGSLWSLLINLTNQNGDFAEWGESWLQNFSTEMFGAFITFMLLTLVVGGREKRQDEEKRIQAEKRRLIELLGSKVNAVALQAAEELAAQGWLHDGSLQNVDLSGANLQGANLSSANLQGVNLSSANLQGANLFRTNLQRASLGNTKLVKANLENTNLQEADLGEAKLQEADLIGTNLQRAYLGSANLQGSRLRNTKLQGANLVQANLQWANLFGANLEGANLFQANLQLASLTEIYFDEKTVLPDGEIIGFDFDNNGVPIYTTASYYKRDVTDMARYIVIDHPSFWQPEWINEKQA